MAKKKPNLKEIKITEEVIEAEETGDLYQGGIRFEFYTEKREMPESGMLTTTGAKSKKSARELLYAQMDQYVQNARHKNFIKIRAKRKFKATR